MEENKYGFTEEEWRHCIKVLSQLKDRPFDNPDNQLLSTLLTKVVKKAKKLQKKRPKEKTLQDLKLYFSSPTMDHAEATKVKEKAMYGYSPFPMGCARCGTSYQQVHVMYPMHCTKCAEVYLGQRWRSIDLKGRKAIVIGGRVKAGYLAALRLLRAGAQVVVTSRFPALALEGFTKEQDYNAWSKQLLVYGLDLRMVTKVEEFMWFCGKHFESLDMLLNLASRHVPPPEDYYSSMADKEDALLVRRSYSKDTLVPNQGLHQSEWLAAFVPKKTEPGWWSRLVKGTAESPTAPNFDDIVPQQFLERSLIHQISPMVLIQQAMPYFGRSSFPYQYWVTATSSEGQFRSRQMFSDRVDIRVNRAGQNMLNLALAQEYGTKGLLANAVDIGWLSQSGMSEGRLLPDAEDAASQMLYPIFESIENREQLSGKLLKNYRVDTW